MIKSINNSHLPPNDGGPRLAIVGGVGVAILVTVVLPLVVSIKLELRSTRMHRATKLGPAYMPDDSKAQRTPLAPHGQLDRGSSDVS